MQVRALIRELGGRSAVADITGATPKAITNWGMRNRVPAAHLVELWHAAQGKGLDWIPPGAKGLAVVSRDETARQAA